MERIPRIQMNVTGAAGIQPYPHRRRTLQLTPGNSGRRSAPSADRRLFLSSGAVLFGFGLGDLLNQAQDCAFDRRIRQLRISLNESNRARHG